MANNDKLPKDLLQNVSQFDQALSVIEAQLKPLTQQTKKSIKQMDPETRAKMNICCAYTVNTLFYMYLKTQGIDPSQHPVKKEIQRIQSYMQKLREKQSNATQNKTDIDEDDSKEDTRTMKLDKEAAQRFLTNTLNKPEAKNSSEDPSPKKRKRKDSEKGNQKKMKTNK